MINDLLYMVGITMLPFLELRASIPYGILVSRQFSWPVVFAVCTVANIAIGPLLYLFMDKCVRFFVRIKPVGSLYNRVVVRSQEKVKPMVDKYGYLGVALFIGVPLPGTGVYSAALGSYLLGMSHKRFFAATVIGVIIAAVLVTIVTLTGAGIFSIFIKA